jgi:hypothetical protein
LFDEPFHVNATDGIGGIIKAVAHRDFLPHLLG